MKSEGRSKGSGVLDGMDARAAARMQRRFQPQCLGRSRLPPFVSIRTATLDAPPQRFEFRGGLGAVDPFHPI